MYSNLDCINFARSTGKMLVFFVILLVLVSTHQQTIHTFQSLGALEFKDVDEHKFKGIPKLIDLSYDEIRRVYHYEQTIVVSDSRFDYKHVAAKL